MTTVNFYEADYQFESIKTDLNIKSNFIEYKLAKQYEYRPTEKTLWATIIQDEEEVARFEFKYGVGIIKKTFNTRGK